MKPRSSLAKCAAWGALTDLAILLISFLFLGGPHGPAGPMFVVGVLNAPVNDQVNRLIPMEQIDPFADLLLMPLVIVVNGALYGLIVGFAVLAWRRVRGGVKAGDVASPAPKIDR